MTERIRGRKLQAIRASFFRQFPLCARCEKRDPPVTRLAIELDHVIALVNGGRDDNSNRQGLCGECHEEKTAEDMGYKLKVQVGFDGYRERTGTGHVRTEMNHERPRTGRMNQGERPKKVRGGGV